MPFLSAFRPSRFRCVFTGLLVGFLSASVPGRSVAQPVAVNSSVYTVPVFVGYFELYSVTTQPRQEAKAPAAKRQSGAVRVPAAKQEGAPPVVYDDNDVPSAQAMRLQEFFSMTLLQTLQKKGFHAARTPRGNPGRGAEIRGVFAEPDAKNRIRRGLLGGDSPNTKFLLYVGIFNLSHQEQPLYLPAPEQPSDSRYGPVITLNTYIPLAKYELNKNPSEEEVKKICKEIAASLATLLDSNPNAFAPE